MDGSNYANEDDQNTWESIGWKAMLIVNRLRCQAQLLELQTERPKKGVNNDKPETDRTTRDDEEEQRRFVEMRLRELADFERRGKGI
jgi:hypothetical protein